jgi:hypothetical protein
MTNLVNAPSPSNDQHTSSDKPPSRCHTRCSQPPQNLHLKTSQCDGENEHCPVEHASLPEGEGDKEEGPFQQVSPLCQATHPLCICSRHQRRAR